MANTVIDIDEEALEQARLFYGTKTKKDTVNRALQDAAARRAESLSLLGKYLHESVDEYERMSEAEKAEFWARMDTTDYKFLAQVARLDGLRDAE
ncbi:MAG: type II toxin-antitoxin system VapB family antitoxin [Kribbellaceae bacterium]